MIEKKSNTRWGAQKLALLIIFSAGILQLAGCGKCKSSGSPASVNLTALNGKCLLDSNIVCKCSGGALSTCADGSQTLNAGDAAPGLVPPCPSTFSCDQLTTCA